MLIAYLHLHYILIKVQQFHNDQHYMLLTKIIYQKIPIHFFFFKPSINGVQSCLVPLSSISISGIVVSNNRTRSVYPFEQARAKTLSPSSLTSFKCSFPFVA
jgi:hypothetical protein